MRALSIEDNFMYNSFTYIINNNPLWRILGPISGDTIAGMLVGLTSIFGMVKTNEEIEIISQETNDILYISASNNSYRLALANYYIDTVSYDDILNDNYIISPYRRSYGWWIDTGNQVDYGLYSFRTVEFIYGFIGICDKFGVDFRDYILGPPFKYDEFQGTNIFYGIEGYDINSNLKYRQPASVGAYYTRVYEADPYGEDYE